MSQVHRGYLFGITAYLIWGLFPLYWKLLRSASALEILAHRVVWPCVTVLAIVAANRIALSAIGLLRYVAPCLQFSIGVIVFDEPTPPSRLAGLSWFGLH